MESIGKKESSNLGEIVSIGIQIKEVPCRASCHYREK